MDAGHQWSFFFFSKGSRVMIAFLAIQQGLGGERWRPVILALPLVFFLALPEPFLRFIASKNVGSICPCHETWEKVMQ
ncbi:hypothetical protein BC940DRAFT_301716 [Gongronella butleri]|nr:hypothetical protein BC940DRAFT_301716 [Gongronella butleri]